MKHGFLTGEKHGLIELAAEQGCVRLGRFEHGPAAATLGEQDFSNVKKRIGTGDLMDFLADEMHRSGIGRECQPHTFGGQNFLNAWRALAAVIEPAVRAESEVFKKLAFEVVFLSPQLKQLEHKGSHLLRGLWTVLEKRYVYQDRIDGQDFQLLPDKDAAEIAEKESPAERARLVCDFLAGMSDGYAARLYKRLFTPDFGSIGDLVG